MEPLSPEEEKQRSLTRDRLVTAGLDLIRDEGLDALSMRSLADRLDVKAASLYWHVRDRRELLDLLAEGLLESVPRPRRSGWRDSVVATAEALRRAVGSRPDAVRLLLDAPGALSASPSFADVARQLEAAGLPPGEAAGVAHVVVMTALTESPPPETAVSSSSAPAELAIDTGSRGVTVRAGSPAMQGLFEVPRDQASAAPAVERAERVVVRRLRGVGQGAIELNPRRAWRFHVQAPTWHTVIDAAGLDVRGVHIDSGAAKVQVFLPAPVGVVPIEVSGGVADVALHRPTGVPVVARLSSGVVKARLDDFNVKVTVADVRWRSADASAGPDRYDLRVHGGAVKVTLDTYRPKPSPVEVAAPAVKGKPKSALDILLDGVEARVRGR